LTVGGKSLGEHLEATNHAKAGHYRSVPARISGSTIPLPNPLKVPDLMSGFIAEITDRLRFRQNS
jgi:hypothetical protein